MTHRTGWRQCSAINAIFSKAVQLRCRKGCMPHWADSSAGSVVRAGFAEATCTPRGWHVSGACYKLAGEGMWTAVLAGTCVIVQATQCITVRMTQCSRLRGSFSTCTMLYCGSLASVTLGGRYCQVYSLRKHFYQALVCECWWKCTQMHWTVYGSA